MKLANEPLFVRTLVGAVLGVLVNFGVQLSGGQVDSILTLADAVIPLVLALVGAVSARWSVDGPVTAADKDRLIADGPATSRSARAPSALIVLLPLLFLGCAAFQSAKPALQTADSVAQQACAVFFGERNRMSVEDAGEQFCAAKEQYQPWIDALIRADRSVERGLPRGE